MSKLNPNDPQFTTSFIRLQNRLNLFNSELSALQSSQSIPSECPTKLQSKSTGSSQVCQRRKQILTPAKSTSEQPVVQKETHVEKKKPEDGQPIIDMIVAFLNNSDTGIKTGDVFKSITDGLGIPMTEKEFALKYGRTFSYFIKKAPEEMLNKLGNPHALFPVAPKGITLPATYFGCLEIFDKTTNSFIAKKPNVPIDATPTTAETSQPIQAEVAPVQPATVPNGPTNYLSIVVKGKTVEKVATHVPSQQPLRKYKNPRIQQGASSQEVRKKQSGKKFAMKSNYEIVVPPTTGKSKIPGLNKAPSNSTPNVPSVFPEKKNDSSDENHEQSEFQLETDDDAPWETVGTVKKTIGEEFSSIMGKLIDLEEQIQNCNSKTIRNTNKRQSWVSLMESWTVKSERIHKESTHISASDEEGLSNIRDRIVYLNQLIKKKRVVLVEVVPRSTKFYERRSKVLEARRQSQKQIEEQFQKELKKFPRRYKTPEIREAASINFKNSMIPHRRKLDMTPSDDETPSMKLLTNHVAVTVDISLWGTMFNYWTACMHAHCRIPRVVYDNIKHIIEEKKAFDKEMREKKAARKGAYNKAAQKGADKKP